MKIAARRWRAGWILGLLAVAGCGAGGGLADARSDARTPSDVPQSPSDVRDAATLDDLPATPDVAADDVLAAEDVAIPVDVPAASDVRPDAPTPDVATDAPTDAGTPAVRFVGRIDRRDAAGPRFSWSGSGLVARFTGTSITLRMRDGGNYFRVAIDGAERPTLIGRSGTTDYLLASGLASGPHTVELSRRTEAFGNPTQFLGFTFGGGGALLPPPPAPARRVELIGDSISCGYGNEGASATCNFSFATENHYLSYGAVAARALGAELITIAWSGYGMYRGYNGALTETMPPLYDRALGTVAGSTWDFSAWTPDAVVINLGTNDWARGDPGVAYTNAYVAFVRRIRGYYPRAYILASIGPTRSPATRIMAALTTLRAAGETRVGFLQYTTPANTWGCDYHPNVVADRAMADQLAAALRTPLGW